MLFHSPPFKKKHFFNPPSLSSHCCAVALQTLQQNFPKKRATVTPSHPQCILIWLPSPYATETPCQTATSMLTNPSGHFSILSVLRRIWQRRPFSLEKNNPFFPFNGPLSLFCPTFSHWKRFRVRC